jgi:hypothetical protein
MYVDERAIRTCLAALAATGKITIAEERVRVGPGIVHVATGGWGAYSYHEKLTLLRLCARKGLAIEQEHASFFILTEQGFRVHDRPAELPGEDEPFAVASGETSGIKAWEMAQRAAGAVDTEVM